QRRSSRASLIVPTGTLHPQIVLRPTTLAHATSSANSITITTTFPLLVFTSTASTHTTAIISAVSPLTPSHSFHAPRDPPTSKRLAVLRH
ncbi:hypothetical protein HETIRDRAFT_439362, partial [Heterobasidion irregulare TC 32-1]